MFSAALRLQRHGGAFVAAPSSASASSASASASTTSLFSLALAPRRAATTTTTTTTTTAAAAVDGVAVKVEVAKVKQLRKATGTAVGVKDCHDALKATGNDVPAALAHLKEVITAKVRRKLEKSGAREMKEGLVVSAVSDDARLAALLESTCETDYVARGYIMQRFSMNAVDAMLADAAGKLSTSTHRVDYDAAQLTTLRVPSERVVLEDEEAGDETIDECAANVLFRVGENNRVRRGAVLRGTTVAAYTHGMQDFERCGRAGVLVALDAPAAVADDAASRGALDAAARTLAVHIASNRPRFVARADASDEQRARGIAELRERAAADDAAAIDEDAWAARACLLEQRVEIDDDTTATADADASPSTCSVDELLARVGDGVRVVDFVYMKLGESI